MAGMICAPPYDVMSTEEARQMAGDNPNSFLRVSRPEIGFPPGKDPHDAEVYAQGAALFRRWIAEGMLLRDSEPAYYLYRQIRGEHRQVGLVGLADCEEYLRGIVRKHEHTRPDKEDDRVRHIEELDAQTGPAFLVYRRMPELAELIDGILRQPPGIDFEARDGVRHSAWVIADAGSKAAVEACLRRVPLLYIADGHHRTAAAARVYRNRGGAGQSDGFLAVLFPDDQVQILPYHRVLRDLNGMTSDEFLAALGGVGKVVRGGNGRPERPGEVGVLVPEGWHTMYLERDAGAGEGAAERLDVAVLQREVLSPLLGIENPRTSQRIAFVGGVRGPEELERLVRCGEYACAFAMRATTIAELLAVADGGGIMPPKSTWFEPKLRDGMFCHLLTNALKRA
jgi:uncharacterized protein (DUF1015 family)